MEAEESPLVLRQPGVLVSMLAWAVAGLWVVAVLAGAAALLGLDRVLTLSVAEALALAGAAVLPALMAVFAGMAARDGARIRVEAERLAEAAERLLNPQQSASEAARRVMLNVRGEIAALDSAVEHTLERLREVEGHIARQASAVSGVADQAKAGANQMISGMERERAELLKISQDLNKQAQTIGDSISRHTQAITEAAKRAETEVRAADQALDHRLTSFGAAAALIGDRTQGLSTAAQASADSALRLESALANALEILTKATSLTDAARQSAEAASLAANSTAGVVRESADRAIDDAKQAAEIIRGEAISIEREAALALERLREAAEAAREAAAEARSAAEANPSPRQRAPIEPAPRYDNSWRDEPDPLDQPPPRRASEPPRHEDRSVGGDWTWRDLLSSSADQPAPQRSRPARAPAEPPTRRVAPPEPHLPVADTIERLGVSLDRVFSPSGLERIAQRARSGTQARRRAVQDAAPEAARVLAEQLAGDGEAKQEAMHFLRTEGARAWPIC